MRCLLVTTAVGLALGGPGCTHHTVDVKPIHMTVDVNIKVDQQLDRFFDFEEEMAAAARAQPRPAAPTQGATQ